jgi:hypothetical protein
MPAVYALGSACGSRHPRRLQGGGAVQVAPLRCNNVAPISTCCIPCLPACAPACLSACLLQEHAGHEPGRHDDQDGRQNADQAGVALLISGVLHCIAVCRQKTFSHHACTLICPAVQSFLLPHFLTPPTCPPTCLLIFRSLPSALWLQGRHLAARPGVHPLHLQRRVHAHPGPAGAGKCSVAAAQRAGPVVGRCL